MMAVAMLLDDRRFGKRTMSDMLAAGQSGCASDYSMWHGDVRGVFRLDEHKHNHQHVRATNQTGQSMYNKGFWSDVLANGTQFGNPFGEPYMRMANPGLTTDLLDGNALVPPREADAAMRAGAPSGGGAAEWREAGEEPDGMMTSRATLPPFDAIDPRSYMQAIAYHLNLPCFTTTLPIYQNGQDELAFVHTFIYANEYLAKADVSMPVFRELLDEAIRQDRERHGDKSKLYEDRERLTTDPPGNAHDEVYSLKRAILAARAMVPAGALRHSVGDATQAGDDGQDQKRVNVQTRGPIRHVNIFRYSMNCVFPGANLWMVCALVDLGHGRIRPQWMPYVHKMGDKFEMPDHTIARFRYGMVKHSQAANSKPLESDKPFFVPRQFPELMRMFTANQWDNAHADEADPSVPDYLGGQVKAFGVGETSSYCDRLAGKNEMAVFLERLSHCGEIAILLDPQPYVERVHCAAAGDPALPKRRARQELASGLLVPAKSAARVGVSVPFVSAAVSGARPSTERKHQQAAPPDPSLSTEDGSDAEMDDDSGPRSKKGKGKGGQRRPTPKPPTAAPPPPNRPTGMQI